MSERASPGDDLHKRLRDLHQRAKRGVLAPDERAEYEKAKEQLSRALAAAQGNHPELGQRRASFRLAVLFKVEITLDGSVQKIVTMDVSSGGFSTLLEVPPPPGTEVSFKMSLSAKDAISGAAVVASAIKEPTGRLHRVSFAYKDLARDGAARLEEALFDAVLLRSLTPAAAFIPAGEGGRAPRPSAVEAARTSSASMPAARPPSAGTLRPFSAPSAVVKRSESVAKGTLPVAVPEPPLRSPPSSARGPTVDELVEKATSEMRGASVAARRVETPFPNLLVADRAASPRAADARTPSATIEHAAPPPARRAEAGAVPARASATPAAQGAWFKRLLPAAVVSAALVASGIGVRLAWRSAHASSRGESVGVASSPSAPLAPRPTAARAAPPAPLASPAPPAVSAVIAGAATPPTPVAPSALKVGTVNVTLAGHRVFIDGRLAGDGPGTFRVSCGAHRVRIGSGGQNRSMDVPCGGEIVVAKP